MCGAWGWQGEDKRAFELPSHLGTALSPDGRARIRYNPITGQVEESVDGGEYRTVFTGAAGSQLRWEDMRFALTRDKQGQSDKPDFDFTNLGLLFPQNNPAEIVYLIRQLPHEMVIGGNLRPHIHFVQSVAQQPTFKMDYRWYDNGGDPSGSFTTLTASSFAFTWASGSILQVASFPEIDGNSITSISSMIDIKLYRDDDVVSGDVLAKEFDLHYQIDDRGSRQEYIK